MRKLTVSCITAFTVVCLFISSVAEAQLSQGARIPTFRARDIQGREVDLEKLLNQDLVILFFFSRSSGQDLAAKLKEIHRTREEKLPIVAVGLKEDEEALRKFAQELQITYYILNDSPDVNADARYGPFRVLPVTFFVISDGTVLNVIEGGGGGPAAVIAKVAEATLQRARAVSARAQKTVLAGEASSIAEEAAKLGLTEKDALSLSGYAQAEMGNLEAAREQFERAQDTEGLAFLALKKGDYKKVIELAESAPSPSGYMLTVKAQALLRLGKTEEALQSLQSAVTQPAAEWQQAEAYNHLGRVEQLLGNLDNAATAFASAQKLDALNISVLTNYSEVLREKGDLEKAAELLETAKTRKIDDSLTRLLLEQIQRDTAAAKELERREAIQKQVRELVERFKQQIEIKKEEDEWTSRPLVVAFLPGRIGPAVYLERAGIDIVLPNAIANQLLSESRVNVVDREMIDAVLAELDLGSSELADPNVRLRLGKLFSANALAFLDFAAAGKDVAAFLRLVDTETTQLKGQVSRKITNDTDLMSLAEDMAQELGKLLAENYLLQGLVAEVTDQGILINLGTKHGVQPGDRFGVLSEEKTITAGGKELSGVPMPVGIIEVVYVEDEVSLCQLVPNPAKSASEIKKELKVKQLPRPRDN